MISPYGEWLGLRQVQQAVQREASEQARLRETTDFVEGIRATAERREPRFTGE